MLINAQRLALASAANGVVFALWPIMWIVVNALLLYNVAVSSGRRSTGGQA